MKTTIAVLAAALFLSLGSDNSYAQVAPRLTNISTRMQVLTGDDVMIGGFIIGGSSSKTVVVRARGPSLAQFGVLGVLANPQVQLVSGQAVIASNDNWADAPNAAALTASGFAPSDANEAAILMTLAPGAYTAIVTGAGNTTGVAIIEVFEVDALNVPLLNISTRGAVQTGDNVMIGGFIIQGSGPQAVVVRARGPSMAQLGVPGLLANPQLQLFSGPTQIAFNDNFQDHPNAPMLFTTGFAPSHVLESAIFITLEPGAYTAVVSGVGNSTGVGIVEVFQPPMMALSSQPANSAALMPVHTPVTVTFTGAVDPATLSTSTFSLIGPYGPVAGTFSTLGTAATFTPGGPLLTEASFTGTVTTGVRDLAGNPIGSNFSFTFSTAVAEPPPIVAGCPTPDANAEIRRLEWGETPIMRRPSGAITTFRLKQSQIGRASVAFLQGQTGSTPGSPYTEITISRCPGVIQPNLHPSCRLETFQVNSNSVTGFNRLPDGYANQEQLASLGCYAPDTEQHYVNVRWTYPTCTNPLGCGFSLQWADGGQ